MTGMIIASHGMFAPGILQGVEMLFGKQKNMKAISLMPEDKLDDFRAKFQEVLDEFSEMDDIVIFTDIKGGTPYNMSKKFVDEHLDSWALVSGMNLPMLITAVVNAMGPTSAQSIAMAIIEDSKNSIQIYPEA